MKTVAVIFCCIVLLGAQLLAARPVTCAKGQTPSACHAACCQHGHAMSCCAAKPPAHSQPAPANRSRTGGQNEYSLLALALLTSAAPFAEVRPPFSLLPPPVTALGAPLYERHCARLI